VDSYFLHCDPATSRSRWQGTVTFDREILGIVVRPSALSDTTDELGAPGTTYYGNSVLEYQAEDVVELLPDRHSVRIDWFSTIGVDQIRVITRGTPGFNYLANFLHKVRNLESSPSTFLDNPFSNSQPGALLFVTQLHNLYTYSHPQHIESPLAVRKEAWDARWMVRTTDHRALDRQRTLAVLVADPSSDAYVHTTTVSNVSGNFTLLDHPSLNGNPDARILVAARDGAVWAPDENLGVWYTWDGRWSIFLQDRAAPMPVGATFNVLVLPDDGTSFVHTVTESSPVFAYIDDPRLNGKGWILPHLTQVWNPGGAGGVYNDHPALMWYDQGREQWAIKNADSEAVPAGSSFNIFVPPTPSFAFEHQVIRGYWPMTFVEHELLDGSPAPILLETPNLAPRGGGGVPNPRPTGVYFEHRLGSGTWGILNQDTTTSLPAGATSNLFQPPMDVRTFVHQAMPENTSRNSTNLDHPTTDRHSEAIVFVTQQWAPGDEPFVGIYNDHNIGVWWNELEMDWEIFNQDGSPLRAGASFNVFVAKKHDDVLGHLSSHSAPVDPQEVAFVHVAAPETLDGDQTVVDHPLLNDQPDLQLIVTQSWNPGGGNGVYNDHPIAVDYDESTRRWSIVNQDGAEMPENAAFNVLPVGTRPAPPRPRACGLGFEGGLAAALWVVARRRRQRATRG
jgi:hypothetical protein